jgi:hypothetical protein
MTTQHGPNWQGGRILSSQGYVYVYLPDHPRANAKGYVAEHLVVAIAVMGKDLPKGAQVHHAGDRSDNRSLVICEDQSYHQLLHVRTRALEVTGDANLRRCTFCKKWDLPENGMRIVSPGAHHIRCRSEYDRNRPDRSGRRAALAHYEASRP